MEKVWLTLEDKLRAFIMSKVNDPEVTADLLQELFIKIHEHIDQLNDQTRIHSWIYQICRNLITDHFRRTKREMGTLESMNGAGPDDTDEEYVSEAIEDMIRMMEEMPPDYCEALCLTELGGLSQKAYAEKLGISYSGAKSRVQRAKKMLRDMLMKCCHYEFDKYGTVIGIFPANCCCCN